MLYFSLDIIFQVIVVWIWLSLFKYRFDFLGITIIFIFASQDVKDRSRFINWHSCLDDAPDVRIVCELVGVVYQRHFLLWTTLFWFWWCFWAVAGENSFPGFEVICWRLPDLIDHIVLLNLALLANLFISMWTCPEQLLLEHLWLSIRWLLKSVFISVKIVGSKEPWARDFTFDLGCVLLGSDAIFLGHTALWVT